MESGKVPEVDGVDATELAELLASLRGDGDGVRFDLLAPIARLARVRALLDAAEGELVVGAKLGGYTWREIAMQADVSASTLLRRHGKRWRTARALRSAALDAGVLTVGAAADHEPPFYNPPGWTGTR